MLQPALLSAERRAFLFCSGSAAFLARCRARDVYTGTVVESGHAPPLDAAFGLLSLCRRWYERIRPEALAESSKLSACLSRLRDGTFSI